MSHFNCASVKNYCFLFTVFGVLFSACTSTSANACFVDAQLHPTIILIFWSAISMDFLMSMLRSCCDNSSPSPVDPQTTMPSVLLSIWWWISFSNEWKSILSSWNGVTNAVYKPENIEYPPKKITSWFAIVSYLACKPQCFGWSFCCVQSHLLFQPVLLSHFIVGCAVAI